MNREETQKFIEWLERSRPAMEGFIRKQEIQFTNGRGEWVDIARASNGDAPIWDKGSEYRIKPVPAIRPYSRDELNSLVGKPFRNKHTGSVYLLVGVVAMGEACVMLERNTYSAKELLDSYQHLDGRPCGITE